MTKAQQDFIAREELAEPKATDARDFLTWYHPEDLYRISYSLYTAQPEQTQSLIHSPLMMVGSMLHTFKDKMAYFQYVLERSDKKVLPFILAPEKGAAHFMSGFIRSSTHGDKFELFLFNPTGYTKSSASKRLFINNLDDVAQMAMHVSSVPVQTIEKDQVEGKDGPALVSCGPISLMFIEYLLKNPQYALDLDESFSLPEHLTQLAVMDKTEYQKQIFLQRQSHYDELSAIADEDLENVDKRHYEPIEQFLNGDWKTDVKHESDLEDDSWGECELENDMSQCGISSTLSSPVKTTEIKKEQSKTSDLNTQLEREKFDILLNQLKKKTDKLIEKGHTQNPYSSQYKKAKFAAEELINNLEKASEQFFSNKININTVSTFKNDCNTAILNSKNELQNHRGWWHSLNPILKGLIGVLATLTFIPALIVQKTTKHGYIGTFFNTPQTDSAEKLELFENNLKIYLNEDLSIKINSTSL